MLTWTFFPATQSHHTLLFFHAYPFSGDMWSPILDRLAKSVSAAVVTLPGLDPATSSSPPWTFTMVSDQVQKDLRLKKIDKVIVCGISMGGYAALDFATSCPQMCEGLILINTQAGGDTNEAKEKRSRATQKILYGDLADYADEFLSSALSTYAMNRDPGLFDRLRGVIKQQAPRGLAQALIAMSARKEYLADLEKIKLPTLVISSEKDNIIKVEKAKEICQKINGCQLEILEEVGHLTVVEAPDKVAEKMSDFINKSVPRG